MNLGDKTFDLKSHLKHYLNDKKFIIHLCPQSIEARLLYSEGIGEILNFLDKGCLLGQRGYRGICKYASHTSDNTDPWHENFCLYNPNLSLDEQLELMAKGKKVLEKTFKISPSIYSPINHLWDSNTLLAAQALKYSFIMDQNNEGINPYEKQGLVIIPEAKIGDSKAYESTGIYTSLDKINIMSDYDIMGNYSIVLPDNITLSKVPQESLVRNEIKKRIRKLERDLAKL